MSGPATRRSSERTCRMHATAQDACDTPPTSVRIVTLTTFRWFRSLCCGRRLGRLPVARGLRRRGTQSSGRLQGGYRRGASNALTWAVINQPEDEPFFAADKGTVAAAKRYAIAFQVVHDSGSKSLDQDDAHAEQGDVNMASQTEWDRARNC